MYTCTQTTSAHANMPNARTRTHTHTHTHTHTGLYTSIFTYSNMCKTLASSTVCQNITLSEFSCNFSHTFLTFSVTSTPVPDVNSPQEGRNIVVMATSASAGAVILVIVLLVVAATIGLVVKCAHSSANRKEGMYLYTSMQV